MFKKENRLVPGTSFSNSHALSLPQFTLKEKTNNTTLNKFGIVVSKKVDARAVARNKIKRIFRTALVDLNSKISAGHDILLVVKKEIVNKTKEENLLSLEEALRKLELIK